MNIKIATIQFSGCLVNTIKEVRIKNINSTDR
jgi:hypothetical protein